MLTQHFNDCSLTDRASISKLTRLNQQHLILELTNYQSCDAGTRQQLDVRARKAAAVCGKPIYIYREIMHYLTEHRIVPPGYSYLQDTVGQALIYENRLVDIMKANLDPKSIDLIKLLLEDSLGLYEITQLKHDPKDFSTGEIKSEIQRGKRIEPLYHLAQELLPKLGISKESVKYYASLVNYYSVFRLKQLTNEWVVYAYLLCFISYRYQRVNDNLINTFLYNVRNYNEDAKQAAKDRVYECHLEANQNLNRAGEVLKIFTDDSIPTNTPFQDVQARAFSILDRDKIVDVADQIAKQAKFDEAAFQWEHVDKIARQIKLNLRPVLLNINFAAHQADDLLIEAVSFLKNAFLKGKPLGQYPSDEMPRRFVPDASKRYIHEQKILSPDRYEFLIYRLLRNGLEAGDIFCRDSVRFHSFEDDLVDDVMWQDKEKLIADTGLTILNRPIKEHLAELEQKLEARIQEVNRRIITGENKHIKITKRGGQTRWALEYPHSPETVNHSFFDVLKPVEIGTLLQFVNQKCDFLGAFEHLLGRYSKQARNDHTLIASLIAWGTNMGLGRMGEISDIGFSQLAATSDNFIRLETLKEANDRVANAASKLPLFGFTTLAKSSIPAATDRNSKPGRTPLIHATPQNIWLEERDSLCRPGDQSYTG